MSAAIQSSAAPARCLDLTRLVSRVGRGPWTGVDRVEAAYLNALLALDTPLFGLVRTSLGFVLLDRQGVGALAARFRGEERWGAPDFLSRLSRRSSMTRRAAESDLRRIALDRARPAKLGHMLKRHLPEGAVWLNVGHTNLAPPVFDAFHALPGGRASVFVHDMIPLDHPEFQRPGTSARFEDRMRSVSAAADMVIVNSETTKRDAARHFATIGRVPPMAVAHLGVEDLKPSEKALNIGLDTDRPYFLTIGTIEPRKNHALLLDVWDALSDELGADERPQLVIAGSRGWNNEEVFRRLDATPLKGRDIHEVSGLNDTALASLIAGARAVLFPSLAEGFGLPACEAASLGAELVVGDLRVFHEVLGNYPIYAPANDMYSWKKIICRLTSKAEAEQTSVMGNRKAFTAPTWEEHFNQVLKLT